MCTHKPSSCAAHVFGMSERPRPALRACLPAAALPPHLTSLHLSPPLHPSPPAANQAWEQPESGLVVRVKSTGAKAAAVTVCRRAGRETLASCAAQLDNDCNGLTGSNDPTCTALRRQRARRG